MKANCSADRVSPSGVVFFAVRTCTRSWHPRRLGGGASRHRLLIQLAVALGHGAVAGGRGPREFVIEHLVLTRTVAARGPAGGDHQPADLLAQQLTAHGFLGALAAVDMHVVQETQLAENVPHRPSALMRRSW